MSAKNVAPTWEPSVAARQYITAAQNTTSSVFPQYLTGANVQWQGTSSNATYCNAASVLT